MSTRKGERLRLGRGGDDDDDEEQGEGETRVCAQLDPRLLLSDADDHEDPDEEAPVAPVLPQLSVGKQEVDLGRWENKGTGAGTDGGRGTNNQGKITTKSGAK